jgi:hypothetical protein
MTSGCPPQAHAASQLQEQVVSCATTKRTKHGTRRCCVARGQVKVQQLLTYAVVLLRCLHWDAAFSKHRLCGTVSTNKRETLRALQEHPCSINLPPVLAVGCASNQAAHSRFATTPNPIQNATVRIHSCKTVRAPAVFATFAFLVRG